MIISSNFLLPYRCVIEPRSLIQRETRYVGTAHNCGKLKGNRRQIDDLDYASAKYRSRPRQRYLINVCAIFFVAVQKKICVLSRSNAHEILAFPCRWYLIKSLRDTISKEGRIGRFSLNTNIFKSPTRKFICCK